ncbi:MAG: hypothetical protein ABFD54_11115 [Armatimonadota bacterium]|nr:hypothetical protein [bacterium]
MVQERGGKNRAWIGVVVGSMILISLFATTGYAANLLSNGSFENWSNGIPSDWRWYAVSGALGSINRTSAPGTFSDGASGALLTWNNNLGDSGLDRWDTKIPAYPSHIYKFLIDGKANSSEKAFDLTLTLCGPTGNFIEARRKSVGSYLNSNFQTFGCSGRAVNGEELMCVGVDVKNSGAGASAYVDNAQLVDVTNSGNRLINGDFENSNTQPLQWRFFNVGGASASAGISHAAYSGSNAALLSVTSIPSRYAGDVGLDTWDDLIPVNGSEPLQVSFAAKKLSGGSDIGLWYEVAQFTASGTIFKADEYYATPGVNGYTVFNRQFITDPNAAYVDIAFRISDVNFNRGVGSFLIDDVCVGEPANLLTNGDFENWSSGVPDDWRWIAVGNADGWITQTTDPGTYSSGQTGVILAREDNVGDSALDRWDKKVPVSPDHIYKLLVDAQARCGEQALNLSLDLCNAAGGLLSSRGRSFGSYLNDNFQTFGLSARPLNGQSLMNVHLDVSNSGAGSNEYLDNVRLFDVTNNGNRLINGDFENSTIQPLQWRFANVGDGSGSLGISKDSRSGSNAALFTVTTAPTTAGADILFDVWDDQVSVNGSEPLQISFESKKLSGGSDIGLCYEILQANASGVPFKSDKYFVTPDTNDYTAFSRQITTDPNAAYISIAFRIMDAGYSFRAGSFLIDDVYVGAVNVESVDPKKIQLSDIKKEPDETMIRIDGATVSGLWNDFLYIEADNRTSGIRVEKVNHGLSGDNLRVDVVGVLHTDAADERYIEADTVAVAGSGVVKPLGMLSKSLSGYRPVGKTSPDPDNIALLVRAWGAVVDINSTVTPAWFKIDDGSGVLVKCIVPAGTVINPEWDYVGVTGISSAEEIDGALSPVIRVSRQSDITAY